MTFPGNIKGGEIQSDNTLKTGTNVPANNFFRDQKRKRGNPIFAHSLSFCAQASAWAV